MAKARGTQLSFFDVDPTLVHFAYDATRTMLVEQFEDAVSYGRGKLPDAPQARKSALYRLTRFALQLLAAAILEDKGLLGNRERSRSARQLIDKARRSFQSYFDVRRVVAVGNEVADGMHDRLRRNLTFQSFTNELLGYFYENAFVDDDLRRDLGVHYTPQHLARRMLSRLPIEEIPPRDRTVFDGTCGSGSLLLAGYERLAALLPTGLTREQGHTYLVRHLHGVDVDPFATEVSQLSLFLLSVPSEDGWDIKARNFLEIDEGGFAPRPTIIVGNPPFKDDRSVGGHREQLAARFLEKYLDLLPPDGLMGIILPETFLDADSTEGARRRLLSECELLEVWHLPEGMFPSSNVATAVILARKRPVGVRRMNPVRVERVTGAPADHAAFRLTGKASYSFIVPSQRVWLDDQRARMNASPFDASLWSTVEAAARTRLGRVAYVRNGIITGKEREELSSIESKEFRPWLNGPTHMEPYLIRWGEQALRYIKYPGDLERPRRRLERVFAAPRAKILVNSSRFPGSPWKLYAAVDDIGLFPRQNLYCIIPIGDVGASLEELAAVLNSPMANAWVDARNRRKWIASETLEDMPYPSFSVEQRDEVVRLVNVITNIKKDAFNLGAVAEGGAADVEQLVRQIDAIVFDAFGIDHELREHIYQYFSQFRRPGSQWTATAAPTVASDDTPQARHVTITGRVLHINALARHIRLWISGYNDDEDFDIPILDEMPGWLLQDNQDFQADAPWDGRDPDDVPIEHLTNYRPLDYAYLSEDALTGLLNDPGHLIPLLYDVAPGATYSVAHASAR